MTLNYITYLEYNTNKIIRPNLLKSKYKMLSHFFGLALTPVISGIGVTKLLLMIHYNDNFSPGAVTAGKN